MSVKHRIQPRAYVGVICVAIFALCCLPGCGTSRKAQLHALAREWFETIRAEQVIPILPISADIQPGDVFLVQMPVDQQQNAWRKGNYMPLDNHIARLDPTGYELFYGTSFFDGGTAVPTLPRDWMRPADGGSAWSKAPKAAFPTLTYETTSGGGFNSMLPIHSVPLGMSLLGTSHAQGTIVINDARTYGVDEFSIYAQLKIWARDHRKLLQPFGSAADQAPRNYLRAVTRVYLAGEMMVTVQDARSISGGADVGAARPVALLYPETLPAAAEDEERTPKERVSALKAGIAAINTMLGDESKTGGVNGVQRIAPGASVRVAFASAHIVGMLQTFDPPLVLGYLGIDAAIYENGEIGPMVPTHSRLNAEIDRSPIAAVLDGEAGERARLLDEIDARADRDAIYLRAAAILGNDWKSIYSQMAQPSTGATATDRFADLGLAYDNAGSDSKEFRRERVNEALRQALDEALATKPPHSE